MDTNTAPVRPLSYDVRKASEAAFLGYPIQEDWTLAAKAVYRGIVEAMQVHKSI
jgi:hypothetical protein